MRSQKPQIMLLDLMMPGMDGFEVCRRTRQFSDIPIIFLSAKDDETDRLIGLNIGGDDYVTKPFHVKEIIARVYSLLRRTRGEVLQQRRLIWFATLRSIRRNSPSSAAVSPSF